MAVAPGPFVVNRVTEFSVIYKLPRARSGLIQAVVSLERRISTSFVPIPGLVVVLLGMSRYRPVDDGRFKWKGIPLALARIFLLGPVQRKAKSGDDVSSPFPCTTI